MSGLNFLKSATLGVACCCALTSHLHAAGPSAAKSVKAPMVSDVALDQQGTLIGRLVDKQGRGVEGAVVSVKYGTREIARTVTNSRGLYRVRGLRGGVHQVVAGRQNSPFRFWNFKTAPPTAKNSALTVLGQQSVVRGQFGALGGAAGAIGAVGGVAGAVFGGLSYSEASDANDNSSANGTKLNNLQNQVDNLPSS